MHISCLILPSEIIHWDFPWENLMSDVAPCEAQETLANGAVYVGQWRGDLRDGFGKQAVHGPRWATIPMATTGASWPTLTSFDATWVAHFVSWVMVMCLLLIQFFIIIIQNQNAGWQACRWLQPWSFIVNHAVLSMIKHYQVLVGWCILAARSVASWWYMSLPILPGYRPKRVLDHTLLSRPGLTVPPTRELS